jgi:hypothetical protein
MREIEGVEGEMVLKDDKDEEEHSKEVSSDIWRNSSRSKSKMKHRSSSKGKYKVDRRSVEKVKATVQIV